MPISLHSHSGQFCKHASGTLEDVVRAAIAKRFRYYGLSEHIPRLKASQLYPEEAGLTPSDLHDTFARFNVEARRLQKLYENDIHLLVGFETEWIDPPACRGLIRELREKYRPDYIVGSVHHVHEVPVDYSKELYDEATKRSVSRRLTTSSASELASAPSSSSLAPRSVEATSLLFEDYYDAQYEMLEALRPDVVGHFDLIRIFAPVKSSTATENSPDHDYYQEKASGEAGSGISDDRDRDSLWLKVKRNVDFVVGYGGLFEFNSKAWRKGLQGAYPCKKIVQYIQSKGGKFTISDDCHAPADVGLDYPKLFKYLSETDVRVIHALRRNETKSDGSNENEAKTKTSLVQFETGELRRIFDSANLNKQP